MGGVEVIGVSLRPPLIAPAIPLADPDTAQATDDLDCCVRDQNCIAARHRRQSRSEWCMKTTVLDVLQRLFGPNLSAKWKILVLFLTISFVWSLMRRGRWSRQRTAVNTVAQTIGFVPLDELPIPRDELKSFELPLGLGKLHNIIGGSVDGNEAVLFDTEVGHTHGEPTLQTIAAFKLTGSNLPNFNLRPRSVASKVLSLFGKGHRIW